MRLALELMFEGVQGAGDLGSVVGAPGAAAAGDAAAAAADALDLGAPDDRADNATARADSSARLGPPEGSGMGVAEAPGTGEAPGKGGAPPARSLGSGGGAAPGRDAEAGAAAARDAGGSAAEREGRARADTEPAGAPAAGNLGGPASTGSGAAAPVPASQPPSSVKLKAEPGGGGGGFGGGGGGGGGGRLVEGSMALRVAGCVTVTHEPGPREAGGHGAAVLEWEGGAPGDTVADAVVAVILQVGCHVMGRCISKERCAQGSLNMHPCAVVHLGQAICYKFIFLRLR